MTNATQFSNGMVDSGKTSDKKLAIIAAIVTVSVISLAIGVMIIYLIKYRTYDQSGMTVAGSYYKEFDEEDLVFPEDGEAYVDCQLLITVNDDVTEKELNKMLANYDGEIVGYNCVTNTYQIEFSGTSGEDMNDLIDEIIEEECVDYASLNYVYLNESIMGSAVKLDNSLMGIANANYDDSLLGELQVALIGTSVDKSGIEILIPDVEISDYKLKDGEYVSLFGWECEFSNKADEGCEIFEVSSNLQPTFDDKKGKAKKALNEDTTDFINMMMEKEYDFMILSSAHVDEDGFIEGIADEKARDKILSVGGMAEDGIPSGVDIYAEGDSPEALEYATSIALMTWLNNDELSGEEVKIILENSYVKPIDEDKPGILDAELATEVARELNGMKSSGYISREDVIEIVKELNGDVTEISTNPLEDAVKEFVESKGYVELGTQSGTVDSPDEDEMYRLQLVDGYQEGVISLYSSSFDDGTEYVVIFYSQNHDGSNEISENKMILYAELMYWNGESIVSYCEPIRKVFAMEGADGTALVTLDYAGKPRNSYTIDMWDGEASDGIYISSSDKNNYIVCHSIGFGRMLQSVSVYKIGPGGITLEKLVGIEMTDVDEPEYAFDISPDGDVLSGGECIDWSMSDFINERTEEYGFSVDNVAQDANEDDVLFLISDYIRKNEVDFNSSLDYEVSYADNSVCSYAWWRNGETTKITKSEEKDEEELKTVESVNEKNTEWKGLYLDKLKEYKSLNQVNSVHFAYIDDDEIPEMIFNPSAHCYDCLLFAASDGCLFSYTMGDTDLKYAEREGVIVADYGQMGYYYDWFYELKNGECIQKEIGGCHEIVEDGSFVGYYYGWKTGSWDSYDEAMNEEYEVDEDTYKTNLFWYDENYTLTSSLDNAMTIDEAISYLESLE